ncbi:3-ketodihydrosphingosine reductase isoform X1 [Lycorma delicatula]|uniref:3-ketodihydrosphingosine reductase isoform X1 n=1 Tax=Lycorma delicatula TaxID=130591 RepID=UPI003F5134E8
MEIFNLDSLFEIFIGTFYATVLSVMGFVVLVSLVMYMINFFTGRAKRKTALIDKHVVVTGGSSGIGKSIAIQAAARGANVTIIARNQSRLNAAKQEVLNACIQNSKDQTISQTINAVSLDVMGDYETVEKVFKNIEEDSGPVFMLVNCAGSSICARFEDTALDDFKYMMDLNFKGTVQPTKSVVAGMKARSSGHIIITASQAALLGIYGYTAYSSSKFALRGFAESLYMELKPFNVGVTLSLPPDTDTPGFAVEEQTKLPETRLICQSSGLISSDVVAAQMLDDAIMGSFFSTVGFEGNIMKILCCGMSPFTSVIELILQVTLMGILRLIGVGYLLSFETIIRKCMKSRNQAKKNWLEQEE